MGTTSLITSSAKFIRARTERAAALEPLVHLRARCLLHWLINIKSRISHDTLFIITVKTMLFRHFVFIIFCLITQLMLWYKGIQGVLIKLIHHHTIITNLLDFIALLFFSFFLFFLCFFFLLCLNFQFLK